MNKQKSEKLRALIEKGKWSYIFKYGVLFWGVLTAILFSALMHFTTSVPFTFTDIIFIALALFPIGGFFWGLAMWFFLVREYRKLEH